LFEEHKHSTVQILEGKYIGLSKSLEHSEHKNQEDDLSDL